MVLQTSVGRLPGRDMEIPVMLRYEKASSLPTDFVSHYAGQALEDAEEILREEKIIWGNSHRNL